MKKIYTLILFVCIAVLGKTQVISAGYGHTLVVCADSTVMAFGNGISGQLGNGTTSSSNVPVSTSNLTSVIAVSASDNFSMALKADGTVWTWGNNGSGQLGNGNNLSSNIPVQVIGLSDIVSISAGGSHAIAAKNDGTLWTWGNNNSGQAGNGTIGINSNTPGIVTGSAGFVKVAASMNHNLGLKNDGTVWAMGNGNSGALGTGSSNSSFVLVQANTLPGVTDIAAGQNFSMALNSDSTVSTWGFGSFGQLGNGSYSTVFSPVLVNSLTQITKIAHGSMALHGLALKQDGTLWAWGNNDYGQLGNATIIGNNSPIQLSTIQDLAEISVGNIHSMATKMDGVTWTWGSNSFGQIGNGTNVSTNIPVTFSGLCLAAFPCTNTYATIDISAFESYVAPSGTTYTSSGVYTDIIQNEAGCDSIIVIKLTLGHNGLNSLQNNLISFYPNPASDVITLTGLSELKGKIEINILSVSGAVVLNYVHQNTSKINLSQLVKGIYFFQLKHDEGIELIRFVKE
jgi:alpha-tubulin suppressor-like RCC1 family protein